ncbi:TPA: HAD-IIIA family hydrolase [Candidatus Woesearchaeota archaeon]|nr:HAD-IIIA family hydrolase [Candidatus Woesearchaeota archaeon]
MKIKAVIFDIDNTLVDFLKLKKSCIQPAVAAMVKKGLKVSEEEGVRLVYKLYEKYGMEYKLIFQELLKEVGQSDYKILAAGILAYRKARVVKPYPGVVDVLKELRRKGVKLAIVSDAPNLKAYIRLVAMGIEDYFDVIVAYDDTKHHKPASLPFEKAVRELAVKPQEVIMIGDMPDKDVKGAKDMGFISVFALYGNETVDKGESGADYEIEKVNELLAVIDRIENK